MGLFKIGQTLPLERVKHDITEDCHIFLREMSAQEQVSFQKRYASEKEIKDNDFLWDVIALCVCDDKGKPLFTSKEDVAEHFTISVSHAQSIVEAILDLSGFKEKN